MAYQYKELEDMETIAAPAGVATPRTQHATLDGITWAYGTTKPIDTAADYAPGCDFTDVGSGARYINEGTAASADFNQVVTVENIDSVVSAAEVVAHIEATELAGTAAGRGPSPLIWDGCPWLQFQMGSDDGLTYFNDFHDGNYVLAANQTVTDLGQGVSGFSAATGGSTISMNADEPVGALTLNSTTDNEDAGICILGGLNTAGQVKLVSGKKFWFEARIKSLNITDAKFGIFCGFAEEGVNATTALISNADALNDLDYVGFHKLAADGDKLDTVHRKNSGAAVTVKADAVTLVANTYKKIGIYCDGTTITFYADGVALADTALLATATVPTGEEMAFYFVAMNAHGDAAESTIDWARIAVEL
ncbi:MAG: hypothetical protein GQ565_02910 [Candidatus Aegiribacteria sp.]|nr:hypothetical protein [Candidatus Aegiribacteria sp.]